MPLLSFPPLTYICNKSHSSGVLPKRLTYAIIKPVYKKGDKLLTTIYRPISLLTSFSKILKKLIYSRLYKYICTNNILVKQQYGFRINSSTDTASAFVDHAYKLCWLTNSRGSRPAGALNKSRPVQAPESEEQSIQMGKIQSRQRSWLPGEDWALLLILNGASLLILNRASASSLKEQCARTGSSLWH